MKKVLLIILSILLFVSFGLIGWYVWILFNAPNKIVSQTFLVGDQVVIKEDGTTEKKSFIDINLYDNVFEIKFNYMLDETRTAFYSQGLQYVLKDSSGDFNLNGSYTNVLSTKTEQGKAEHYLLTTWERTDTITQIWGDKSYLNVDKFNYMSGDDYATPLISTNPIDRDTFFKIQLGDDLYGMKFRGINIDFTDEFYLGSNNYLADTEYYVLWAKFIYNYERYYKSCDVDYFATLLFNSISQSVKAGTNQILTFEFGDLFEYYEFDTEKQQYSDKKVESDKSAKISADIKSYYSINVSVHEGDMTSSSQSLFNSYKGNSNYNVDLTLDDYFVGRNIVEVDVNKFDFIETSTTGVYYLSLAEDFKTFYDDYKHLVEFEIVIDLDYLNSLGVEYIGVIENSLDGFKIFGSETRQVINGEIVKGDVIYV